MSPSSAPPLERVAALPQATMLDATSIDSWLADRRPSVLFFAGASRARAEAIDVAVVLCEIARQIGPRLRLGLVAGSDEERLAPRFGVIVWPSLVFVHDGAILRVVPRIRDWPVYEQAFAEHLSLSPVS